MKRSKHSLSNTRLMSGDMGILLPIGCLDVLPGDTIQHSTSALIRAAPLLSPVMHPITVRIHHWYVPYRLIWSEFEDFITGGPAGTSLPSFPRLSTAIAPWTVGSLGDYLGLPVGVAPMPEISALPIRAYQTIWNQNYRDEDLETLAAVSTASGIDATTNLQLKFISWEKDYFTSSRPWEQKGPAITVPLGTTAPVVATAANPTFSSTAGAWNNLLMSVNAAANPPTFINSGAGIGAGAVKFGNQTGLETNLAGASAITVTALRQALALQRFEEARARYGSRYVEYLRYLGVRSSDARLQRPEYLGGGKQTIQFSEVLQTGPSASPDQANTVGALKGHGIGAMRSNRYRRFIEEHGVILSLMSIRPKTMYMNGVDRMWLKRSKEDFWQKELEHIGQQQVTKAEVYAAAAAPGSVFGYQDRYDEYRRARSGVSGEFRTTLNYWHLARDFASEPSLNASFVSCVPTMRTFASAITDPFYVMVNHSIQARRLVSGSAKSYIF